MRKLLALTGISCLAAAGLLSCATARPPSRWHRFAPTRSNFRAYFAERDSLYYFYAAHVLRGDPCLARPCEGTVVVKDSVLQFPVRYVIHSRRSYCWRIDEYWAKTYPAGS